MSQNTHGLRTKDEFTRWFLIGCFFHMTPPSFECSARNIKQPASRIKVDPDETTFYIKNDSGPAVGCNYHSSKIRGSHRQAKPASMRNRIHPNGTIRAQRHEQTILCQCQVSHASNQLH